MSVYSTNQARHLYVVATASEGWSAGKDAEGNLFMKFLNASGELIRTDLIANILNAKITRASKLARTLNAVSIVADSDPVVGTAYTLGITYREFVAASDESLYHEWASVKATTTSKSDLYKALAIALAKNTAKQGLVEIGLYNGTTTIKVTETTDPDTLTSDYTELHIIEKVQPWVLGTTPQTQVFIDENAIVCSWGTASKFTPTGDDATITDGKEIADLEYFCLGERGDQYRGTGWPYVTPTVGRVEADKQYDVIDIHYAYAGANEGVQKSEKTLTIAVLNSAPSASYTTSTLVNVVAAAINTAAGSTVVSIDND